MQEDFCNGCDNEFKHGDIAYRRYLEDKEEIFCSICWKEINNKNEE